MYKVESYVERCTILVGHSGYIGRYAMLSTPAADEGSLSIEGPASTECDKFLVKVFIDGIQIDLSSKEAVHNYKCGQVIYSISADNTLTAVYIPSLAENELTHAKRELLGE